MEGGRAGAAAGMRMIRVLPWLLIAPLFLVPLGAAVYAACVRGSPALAVVVAGSGRGLWDLWTSPAVLASLRFSAVQGFLSACLALVLGLPGAFAMARYRFGGRRFFAALSSVPFVFPPVLFTLGFVQAFGRNGVVNSFLMQVTGLGSPPLDLAYSLGGVVLAHGLFNFPLVTGLMAGVLRRKSGVLEDAARSLGAGEVRVFCTITLPAVLPAVVAAFSLVFLYCFMSFAIPLALGGGPGFATLEVSIYAAVNGGQDFAAGAAIALLEGLCSLLVLVVWVLFRRRDQAVLADTGGCELLPLRNLPLGRQLVVRCWLGLTALLAMTPALALLYASFKVQGRPGLVDFPSLGSWVKVFLRPETMQALVNSALLALVVGGLACLLALLILFGESRGGGGALRSVFFALPVALSSVMLSLGYLVLFPRGGTLVALVLIQVTAAYPLAYRGLSVARSRISDTLEDAASLLGAGKFRVWLTIDARIMRPALLSSWALCSALSLGEINGALMLNLADFPLLGLSAYRMMGSYQYPMACVIGVLICVIAGLAFWWAEKVGGDE